MKPVYFFLWTLSGFLLLFFYFRLLERRTLFFPLQDMEFSPKDVGLEFEEVNFWAKDKTKLSGWWIPHKKARFTILFCHGNAGNISHRLEKILFFHQLNCNVFIFDYRGYGKSQGRPSEKGLYQDVQAAYDYLLGKGIKESDIIGYGESLGGAVVVELASKNKLAGLVVDSSISSAKDMAKTIFPFLPHWTFASRLDSVSKIRNIHIPKLIIHSLNDEIVPFEQGKKLYDSAAGPKEFLAIRGGHNSGFFESNQKIKEKLIEFIKNLQDADN